MIETHVLLIVLFAAVLHATWNGLVKGASDKVISMTAVVLGHVPIALLVLPFVPLPDAASFPYIVGGAALHVGYQLFLLWAYRHGDLTQVYPIARGTAPLIVAACSVLIFRETLSTLQLIGITTIGCGIMSLVLVRGSQGLHNPRGAALALITGCFVAGYSMVDGYGARAAGTPVGFYAWETMLNAATFALIIATTSPGTLRTTIRSHKKMMAVGGGASFLAYALVVWAFTQAPIAVVTALRETSIVFALLIGVFLLKERLNLVKLVSAMLTMLGALMLRFAK
ncbi:MAG: DMT family transporter [Bradyrhizobium sp.]|nr:DMT family transporter [Bradyrhizobium sp.]